MATPAFNPSASYSIPSFDPTAAYQTADAAASAPQDNRNFIQKGFDRLVNVTPQDEAGHSALFNRAQEFGAGAIQGLGSAVVHPLDTLEGIGHTIAHPVDTATALARSAVQNPAQAAGNLVGGALLGEAGAAGAGAVNKVASPVISRGLLLGRTPAEAYETALKPSTALSPAERSGIVQTGLEQGIPVTKGGAAKIDALIDKLNQNVKDTIAADPTRPVSTVPAVRNLDAVRANFANQVTPQPDLAEINQVQRNFLNNSKVQPSGGIGPQPGSLPAADAQAMKQGTYRALGDKSYGELKGANIEAQKALARGLKDEIANQFPELKDLNAQESKLLDLQPVLEKAVARIGNHQLIGIGTPIVGVAGEALTGSAGVGRVLMVMKGVLDNPAVKSRLAIALQRGAKIPYSQAAARVAAYSSALGASAQAPPGDTNGGTPSQ
jgi:hypothetical protein